MTNKAGTCSVEGCGKYGPMTMGWCHKHYARFRKHGDTGCPEDRRAPNNPSDEQLLDYWGWDVDSNGCWIARGARNKDGYVRYSQRGEKISAHRVSYQVHVGPIPLGSEVCHTCDTRDCINPNHLYVGSHSENMVDRSQRGRHPGVVLDPEKVREIRRLRASGLSRGQTATAVGASVAVVTSVTSGKNWRWVV